jgi:hypothetical protein
MKLAIWSTTTPRENSTHRELFRRQLGAILDRHNCVTVPPGWLED